MLAAGQDSGDPIPTRSRELSRSPIGVGDCFRQEGEEFDAAQIAAIEGFVGTQYRAGLFATRKLCSAIAQGFQVFA